MTYTKQVWQDAPSTATPLSAARLNYMEDGLQALSDDLTLGNAWATYSPTLSNITLGAGSVSAAFARYGKTVFVRFRFVMGSGSAMGTNPAFSLPIAARSASDPIVARGHILDSGTDYFDCFGILNSSTVVGLYAAATSAAYASRGFIGASIPMTWTTNDELAVMVVYQAA